MRWTSLRVKAKIRQVEPGLPEGSRLFRVRSRVDQQLDRYAADYGHRSDLTVSLIVLLFLCTCPARSFRDHDPDCSADRFIPFRAMGITANICRRVLRSRSARWWIIDCVVRQAHKKLEIWESSGRRGDYKTLWLQR